jgi:hypothetical protein
VSAIDVWTFDGVDFDQSLAWRHYNPTWKKKDSAKVYVAKL